MTGTAFAARLIPPRKLIPLVLLASACGTEGPESAESPSPADTAEVLPPDDTSVDLPDPPDGTTDAVEVRPDTPGDTADAEVGAADADSDAIDADGGDGSDAEEADADISLADVVVDIPPDAPSCDDRGPVTLETNELSVFYWRGSPAEIARVGVEADIARCGPLAVLADASWARATIADGELVVTIDEETIPSGRHRLTIVLFEPGGDLILATLHVELRAFSGSVDAEPRVLFIGIDGMRPDAMLAADTPNIDALLGHAAWSPEASTHLSTATDSSAGWTSLVTGVDSDKHGVLNNGSLHLRDPRFETFAQRATTAGLDVALTAHWAPFAAPIHEPTAASFVRIGGADFVTDELSAVITEGDYDAYLIHLDDVDHAGHATGFSPDNPEYIEAIEADDVRIGRLIDAILERATVAAEDWLITVVTDHGGRGTGHGPMDVWNQRIALIVAGTSRSSGVFHETVTQMDVAPTILDHLGIDIDLDWELDGVVRGLGPTEVGPWSAPETETACADGFDDDFDRLLDCADDDCAGDERCTFGCAESDLGSAVGEVATGTNEGAETDYVIDCGRLDGGADVSFAWTAPSSGDWTFDTIGSDFDTMLAVFDGECVGPTDRLACNDDSEGLLSSVTVTLDAGQVITVVVAGFDARTGDYVLNITGPL